MDIQSIVNNKVSALVAEGTLEKIIEENVQASIERAIQDQFRSFGSVTKQIEKALEEGLQLKTSDIPFESYNQQMLVAIKTKLGNMFASEASEKFLSEIDTLLAPAPKEVSINELVEKIIEFWRDGDFDHDDMDEHASVELTEWEFTSRSEQDYKLKIWAKTENAYSFSSSKRSEDIHIFINDGRIRINHGQSYNPTCFSASEAYIFKLYSAGTKITGLSDFDPDDCDLQLIPEEY